MLIFVKLLIYQVLTSNQMRGKMAAVYRIFILHQIKFEKNGFHRLVGKRIGFKGANFLRNSIIWCWMMLIFVELLIYQVLTSNQMHGKMAAVYRIFILHQIKFEKNGFHRLVGKRIGFKGANFFRMLSYWCWMIQIFVKLLIYQVFTSNEIRGKWPLFTELSFFNRSSLRKTVFTQS